METSRKTGGGVGLIEDLQKNRYYAKVASANANNGTNNPNAKVPKAQLLCSARLTLSIICMLATLNFMMQRLTINFGLVCMVKTPTVPLNFDLTNVTDDGEVSTTLFRNLETDLTVLNETFEDFANLTEAEQCKIRNMKNRSNLTKFAQEGEFDWSRETQGAILASFYYGFVFSQIPGGWFADRFGAKPGLILSGLFLSLLSLLTPVSAHMGPQWVFTLRLLMGIVNGAAMPAISILSSRWFADIERGLMLGIAYAGFGIATAITYPISAFFCEFAGWPALFYFAGGVGLVWCFATLFLIYDWPENHPRISTKELNFIQKHRAVQYGGPQREKVRVPWGRMLVSIPVWALLITNFSCFWLFLTMGMYLPTYLKEVLYLDITQNGLLSALPFAGMMTFHFIVALGFDRLRKKNWVRLTNLRKIFNTFGCFTAAACMIGIGFVPCDSVLGAIFMITLSQIFIEFAFMGGFIFSIFELAPTFAGNLTAMMNTFGLLAGFTSPVVVSYLTPNGSREEWLLVFYIAAAISAFGGVVYLLFGTSELQPWATGIRPTSRKPDKEMKLLKINLINGESNINGVVVKS